MKNVLIIALFITIIRFSVSKSRTYYLAAKDVEWNYMPKHTKMYNDQIKYAKDYVENSPSEKRIGKLYKKSVFRGYTDETYTTATETETWWGILGPPLIAEVGDEILVHVWNNASHNITFHTHGAFYDKTNEGAYTYNSNDGGNFIPIGGNFTYRLDIDERIGPTDLDPNCVILTYHSHYDGDIDILSGLVGPLVICKKGKYNDSSISPLYALLFLVFDENMSWYIDENIGTYIGDLNDTEIETLKEDENFMESNRKYAINGLLYDNIQGLSSCCDKTVSWHVIGFGNEIDIHNIVFGTHSIVYDGHRNDRIHVTPGVFMSPQITAQYKPGTYSIKSDVGTFSNNGMEATFTIRNCNCTSKNQERNRERHYYIAIEEILWNYAPTEMNMISYEKLSENSESSPYTQKDNCTIGTTYKKVAYKEYDDEHFLKPKPSEWHMGFLGPVIRTELGNILKVTLRNTATFPFNFHSTAFVCENCTSENKIIVQPGETKTYEFVISNEHMPTENDPQCLNWIYHSNVNKWDQFAGLVGVLMTCRNGSLNDDGHQKNIKNEYSLLFSAIDENKSPYFKENVEMAISNPEECDLESEDFMESNRMYSINGMIYGNLLGLYLCLHEETVFNLLSLNENTVVQVVSFEENIFTYKGMHKTSVELAPGDHQQISMSPDVTGKFKIHSHVNDHLRHGMITFYNVLKCNNNEQENITHSGKQRQYFIAAEEVENWNYTSGMKHPIYGDALEENVESKVFVENGDTRIGSTYKKVLYREYTDATFKDKKEHSEHLGILGPIIRGEVYDTIKITFKNLASRNYNIQPQGLLTMSYETVSPVKPGEIANYTWFVTEKSGPSKNSSTTNWLYYSTVDVVKDTQSGLVGMIIIYKPGYLQTTASKNRSIKEFATLYAVIDENESWYLDWNIQNYCKDPVAVEKDDEDFIESNKMHSINGYLYGSLKGLKGKVNETVMFYLCGLGNEVDIHTAHFHGLTAIEKGFGHRQDVVELLPSTCKTAEVFLRSSGEWLFHCHVLDHMKAGMMTIITVDD